MKTLAQWLQGQLEARGLTQAAASVHAGVSTATISQMLNQDHVPSFEILFRLADFFETPREKILRIVAGMPIGGDPPPGDEDEYLVEELVEEFRQVPDEWKGEVLQQVRMFQRLAAQRPARLVAEEGAGDEA